MIALFDDYRKELLEINTFAEDTVENYVSCVVSYCEYAKNSLKIVPVYSKGPHILKWMARLREKGISNSRMQHHHSALKTFFALLCKLKIITKNPAKALPVIRKKISDRNKPISKRVARKLLRSVDQSTWHGKRNFCVISMLWTLGLRISELTSLKVKSFEPDHDPLFPIQSGKAISNNRVLKMIKEYSVKADIKERITPHVLRHSFATEMYHKGVLLSSIQTMLGGHCTKAKTAIYVHVSDQLQKQALEQITIERRLSWQ